MMGGTADATSELGQGSVFGFSARLTPTAQPKTESEESTIGLVAAGRRVLLAEDGLVNQRVAIGLLEKRGHHVDLVENGRQALDAMEKNSYDVVLMDVQMPEMDGITAVQHLRQSEKGTACHQWVVAMTAHAMSGDKERFMRAGMDSHLIKPFKPADLYAAVERVPQRYVSDTCAEISDERQVLDESAALESTGGDAELTKLLQSTCVEEAPKIIAEAKTAVDQGDWITARRCGHSLKSSFGAIGAKAAAAKSQELENLASTDMNQFKSAIELIEATFQQLVARIGTEEPEQACE
jgi:CheY-like chemotaxis protein